MRSESDIYYEDHLQKLKEALPNFTYEYILSRPSESWKGRKGYVQHFLNDVDYKNTPTTFYLCGNGGMIKEVKQQLLEVDGLPKTSIWAEAFD